jgi:hypothetical protein
MVVSSAVELYTTLLGWHLYNSIWTLISSAGIIAIPFIVAIVGGLLESRKGEGASGKELIGALETRLYAMIVVVFFCVQPAVNFKTESAKIYASGCSADGSQQDPGTKDFGDSGTTYDKQADALENTMGGRVAQVPIWWHFWMKINYAVTNSLKNELPCDADVRSVVSNLANLQITDPILRDETNQFYRDCYLKAANKYMREQPDPSEISNAYRANKEEDMSWIGSQIFVNKPGYYDQLRPSKPIKAFPYSVAGGDDVKGPDLEAIRDSNGSSLVAGSGWPTCDNWWSNGEYGLRDRLLADIKNKGLKDGSRDAYAAVAGTLFDTQRQSDDALLQAAVAIPGKKETYALNNSLNTSYSQDVAADGNTMTAALTNLPSGMGELLAQGNMAYNTLTATMQARAIRAGAPVVQSIVLMMLILTIPLIMLFSQFNLGTAVTLAVVHFSVVFWSFLFELAKWLDNFLLKAVMDKGTPDGAMSSLSYMLSYGGATDIMAINYITMAAYVALPLIFSALMGISGNKLALNLVGIDSLSGGVSKTAAGGFTDKISRFKR